MENPPEYRAGRRAAGAATALLVITAAAFWLLLTGHIEGGPFVSMLTLALATTALILLWERIGKINFMGNKIELRDLARRAEKGINELSESRAATLKTALSLTGQRSSHHDGASDDADTLALLDHIDRSGLTPTLAEEVMAAADRVIDHVRPRAHAAPEIQGVIASGSREEAPEAESADAKAQTNDAVGQLARALYHRDRARAFLRPAPVEAPVER